MHLFVLQSEEVARVITWKGIRTHVRRNALLQIHKETLIRLYLKTKGADRKNYGAAIAIHALMT